jgi:predicted dinucleotide-utilizing enzyme
MLANGKQTLVQKHFQDLVTSGQRGVDDDGEREKRYEDYRRKVSNAAYRLIEEMQDEEGALVAVESAMSTAMRGYVNSLMGETNKAVFLTHAAIMFPFLSEGAFERAKRAHDNARKGGGK